MASMAFREKRYIVGLCVVCGKNPYAPDHKLCQPCLDEQKTNQAERHAKRRADGKCQLCGINQPKPDRKSCVGCINAASTTNKKHREQNKNDGICVDCKVQPARKDYTTCTLCAKNDAERMKKQRVDHKANGICRLCNTKAINGLQICVKHQLTERARNKKRKQQRMEAGLCISCKNPRLDSGINCHKHYIMHLAYLHLGSKKHWQFLEKLLTKQNNACFYCGMTLQLAVNSTTDHCNPISKFPNQKHNYDNIVWSCIQCNMMKWNLTTNEFLTNCRNITNNWSDRG